MKLTREQHRASFALERVKGISKDQGKYKTQLLKLPSRLHRNGLGQTVAFYLSQGNGSPEHEICGWLEKWLQQTISALASSEITQVLTGEGLSDPEGTYRRASTEARALALWLKRFAEAFLAVEAA